MPKKIAGGCGAPTIAAAAQSAAGATTVRITDTGFKKTGLALTNFTIGGAQSAKVTGISGTPTATAVKFKMSADTRGSSGYDYTRTILIKFPAASPNAGWNAAHYTDWGTGLPNGGVQQVTY
jgi:hypothetical protein